MTKEEILGLLKETGVHQKGHFLLSSGRHSDTYLQCAKLLQYPEKAALIAEVLKAKLTGLEVDTVIGPALGGVIIAYEVARALGVRALFAERGSENVMSLRRGFQLHPGEKVLIVEDVVTTGGSVQEVIDLIRSYQIEVVGVASIIDRSNGKADFGVPFYPLLTLPVVSYTKEDCPLCQEGIPLTKPGSRKQVSQ
ncbi:MAG: orotate phosphoribosyltransferase [Firmicutes bacterium]|nr:orotate phosphoribosyltransferase [Bacillota bacterium]